MKKKAAFELVSGYEVDQMEIESYKAEGWLLLPNLLNEIATRTAREDLHRIMNDLGVSDAALCNSTGTRSKLLQTAQYLNGSSIDKLVNSSRLRALAEQLLEAEATLYYSFTAVKSGGGGGKFHFHQDNNYTRFANGLGGVNIWFALVDMTPENGCLCIKPRSHLNGTIQSQNAGEGDHHQSLGEHIGTYLPVRMRAGDAVAFSRLTVHGSGANHTDQPRFAYSVHFHRDDTIAVWDGQEPRLLKAHPRWNTSGVDAIVPDANEKEPR